MICARAQPPAADSSLIQSVASWRSCECECVDGVPVRILIACKVVQFYNGNHFICENNP